MNTFTLICGAWPLQNKLLSSRAFDQMVYCSHNSCHLSILWKKGQALIVIHVTDGKKPPKKMHPSSLLFNCFFLCRTTSKNNFSFICIYVATHYFLSFFFSLKIMTIIIHQVLVLCGCRIQMAWQMEPERLVKMSQTHPLLKYSIGNLNKTKDLKLYGLERVVSYKVHVQRHGWLSFLKGNFLYHYFAICALFNDLTLKKNYQILPWWQENVNSNLPLL